MKKILRIIVLSIIILILFRGVIYRSIVNYREIGTRSEIGIISEILIEQIEELSSNIIIDLEAIMRISGVVTRKNLRFSTNKISNNPNESIITKQANCVGYSTMFNSVANYLIDKNQLQDEVAAEHKIGEIDLFGINLHQYFKSAFFKDHDFNIIVDKKTGKIFSIDPSLNDYFRIKTITKK